MFLKVLLFRLLQLAKILHITEALGSGVYHYLEKVCNRLAKEHKVSLCFSTREELPSDFRRRFDPNIKLYPITLGRSLNPLKVIKEIVLLVKLIQELGPDVIHLHSSKAGAVGRAAAYCCGASKVTVYSPHGLAFLRLDVSSFKRWLYVLFERLGVQFGGRVLACSQSEFDEIKNRVSKNDVFLLENAIETAEVPQKVNYDGNKLILGTIGRICPQKNPTSFLNICQRIKKSYANVEFMWIGNGDDERVKERFAELGVKLTGWLPHDQLLKSLGQVDIYIQTSLWEGMPLSLIESQVMGIPGVVSDVVGNRDVIVDGKTGFIARNEDEFVSRISCLIDDYELVKELGIKAREIALERFNFDHFMSRLAGIYFFDSVTSN